MEKTGTIVVVANDTPCFEWTGTKAEAIELQKQFLEAIEATPYTYTAESYAILSASYLLTHGMPELGGIDYRPSRRGKMWQQSDINVYQTAVLWKVLREVEDIFVGEEILVRFECDPELASELKRRDLLGIPPSPGNNFRMRLSMRRKAH